MKRLVPILIAACATGTSRPMVGQQPTPPAIVAQRFFDAVSARQWEEAALALDEAPLIEYRDSMLALRRRMPTPRQVTAEDLLRHNPSMPRAVAEYQAAQLQRLQTQRTPYPDFPSIPSSDSLARLSGLDLAVAWLQGQDHREQLLAELRRLNCPGADSLLELWALEITILGSIVTDTLAYVLYSDPHQDTSPGDLSAFGPSVLQLRRGFLGWRIVPQQGLLRGPGFTVMGAACPDGSGVRR